MALEWFFDKLLFNLKATYKSYIYDWEATNCSREGQEIFSEKSDLYNKEENTAQEFQQLWGRVMQKSDLKHFDDEVFTISGKVLNKIVKTSAEFSIKNYMEIRENCGQKRRLRDKLTEW